MGWKRVVATVLFKMLPNWPGVLRFPPGHYYSPLLDLRRFKPGLPAFPHDGAEMWECIDLRSAAQRTFYEELLERFPPPQFPRSRAPGFRYYLDNDWFPAADAVTLSGILQKVRPRRIIEVGSGFSTAAALDTLSAAGLRTDMSLIEPQPERLYDLINEGNLRSVEVLARPVQEIDPTFFDALEPNDILFIDSSHVVKVGSDVSYLLLRILPRLKAGVYVHFHDVFFPHSYPADWIREGRAWNESLALRSMLAAGDRFEIVAFVSFAAREFHEMFATHCPLFIEPRRGGSSLWLRKRA